MTKQTRQLTKDEAKRLDEFVTKGLVLTAERYLEPTGMSHHQRFVLIGQRMIDLGLAKPPNVDSFA